MDSGHPFLYFLDAHIVKLYFRNLLYQMDCRRKLYFVESQIVFSSFNILAIYELKAKQTAHSFVKYIPKEAFCFNFRLL